MLFAAVGSTTGKIASPLGLLMARCGERWLSKGLGAPSSGDGRVTSLAIIIAQTDQFIGERRPYCALTDFIYGMARTNGNL